MTAARRGSGIQRPDRSRVLWDLRPVGPTGLKTVALSGLRACALVAVALTLGPGAARAQSIAITGGTVHPVSGPPIEDGIVLITDGRIAAVGSAANVRIGNAEVIDATGKVVTPGLLEAGTQLGLVEVGAVASTRHGSLDDGAIRSAFRVADSIDPRSMLFPIARADGVTHAIAAPSGGVISGQGVALTLMGSTRRDVLLRESVALFATLGPRAAGSAGGSRGGVVMALRKAFDDARDAMEKFEEESEEAADGEGEAPDPLSSEVAPLAAVLSGEIPLVVRASGATDIEMALELQAEYGFRMIVDGGEEGWLVADQLAAANVPVLIRALENRPTQFDRLATRYETPGLLSAAGVDVILTTRSSHRVGQVTHEAGNAVRYGMAWDEALEAVTLAPARAFGLDDELGSLEVGKRANVVIWSDDPFEFSGYAERVFIDGAEIDMVTRQRQLFDRYRRLEKVRR